NQHCESVSFAGWEHECTGTQREHRMDLRKRAADEFAAVQLQPQSRGEHEFVFECSGCGGRRRDYWDFKRSVRFRIAWDQLHYFWRIDRSDAAARARSDVYDFGDAELVSRQAQLAIWRRLPEDAAEFSFGEKCGGNVYVHGI